MNEQERHSQQKIYECIEPGARFAMVADDILEVYGREDDADTASAVWHGDDGNDEYALLCYRREKNTKLVYRLAHNDKRHTENSMTRYTVIAHGDDVTNIMLVNENRLIVPLDNKQQRIIARQALEILAAKQPESAQAAKEIMIDRRFPRMVANFVLSDFADEENSQVFDKKTVQDIIVAHQMWVRLVQRDEVNNAKALASSEEQSQLAHAQRVERAAKKIPPDSDGKNSFIHVPLAREVLNLAADMNYKWDYTVTGDTDNYAKIIKQGGIYGEEKQGD